jgi:hypothetical protein
VRGGTLLVGRDGAAVELWVLIEAFLALGMWSEALGIPRLLWAMWIGGAFAPLARGLRSSVRISDGSLREFGRPSAKLVSTEGLAIERDRGQRLGRTRYLRTLVLQDGRPVFKSRIGRDGLIVKGSLVEPGASR